MMRFSAAAKIGALTGLVLCAVLAARGQSISAYNLAFSTPAEDSWGSMVLGNGDISANAWVEKGDLYFYIGKTDSRDSYDRLLKVGKVRVRFEPNILAAPGYAELFELNKASWRITTSQGEIRMWVDANRPCVVVRAEAEVPVRITAETQIWRRERKPIPADLLFDPNLRDDPKIAPIPVFEEPDETVPGLRDRVAWLHRNRSSDLFDKTMALYRIPPGTVPDPLRGRIFGALLTGAGFRAVDETTLASAEPTARQTLVAVVHTERASSREAWLAAVSDLAAGLRRESAESLFEKHCDWWSGFWNRSYILVSSNDPAQNASLRRLTRAYQYQRYVNAVAGRGEYPIKFNGSTLVLDTYGTELSGLKGLSADYRRWGGGLWWQNTRLPYWNMLASGDFDMMERLFRFYAGLLPAVRAADREVYGHEGAIFEEYTLSWGVASGSIYGWDRSGRPPGAFANAYVGGHWVGNWELLSLMLDYVDYTGDERLAAEVLRPVALEILKFYKAHFKARDANGRMVISPSRALETYTDCVNGLPEVAGMRFVLPRLLQLPARFLPHGELRRLAAELLRIAPDIPRIVEKGKTILAPAETIKGSMINVEQPELYAVFPFRLHTLATAGLELGRATFLTPSTYGFKHPGGRLASIRVPGGLRDIFGWQQTGVQAAYLGLTRYAAEVLLRTALAADGRFRFPVYYGPNYDYTPDQDHASVMMTTLQAMVLQSEGDRIFLLPAFPRIWNVTFKLRAAGNTIVEAEYVKGRRISLQVTPPSRAASITAINELRRH